MHIGILDTARDGGKPHELARRALAAWSGYRKDAEGDLEAALEACGPLIDQSELLDIRRMAGKARDGRLRPPGCAALETGGLCRRDRTCGRIRSMLSYRDRRV